MHFLQSLIDFVLGLDESLSNLSLYQCWLNIFRRVPEKVLRSAFEWRSRATGARSARFRGEIFNSRLKAEQTRPCSDLMLNSHKKLCAKVSNLGSFHAYFKFPFAQRYFGTCFLQSCALKGKLVQSLANLQWKLYTNDEWNRDRKKWILTAANASFLCKHRCQNKSWNNFGLSCPKWIHLPPRKQLWDSFRPMISAAKVDSWNSAVYSNFKAKPRSSIYKTQ